MSLNSIDRVQKLAEAGLNLATEPLSQPTKTGFGQFLIDVIKENKVLEEGLTGVVPGDINLSPRELIAYQVKAAALHLRVELLSKVGESVSATIRKLQQNG